MLNLIVTGYEFYGGHWRSVALKALTERSERHGVQIISKAVICHGAGIQLRAVARLSRPTGGSVGMSVCKNHYKAV